MTTHQDIIAALDLERFFSPDSCQYDLLEGTITNIGGGRLIHLSADVVLGVHQALVDETGPAWRLILKNCGSIWGHRVAGNLDRDLKLVFQTTPGDLPMNDYVRLIEGYFRAHGWGRLTLGLDHADAHGVITARLDDSLFAEVLTEETGHVDHLVAGMLRGLFEHVSGRELDCLEIACARTGAEACEFVISGRARLSEYEDSVDSGEPAVKILAELCAK